MKLLFKLILILTILLSLATGFFKIMQQKADIDLFQAIGIGVVGTTILGVIQVIGGILLVFSKSRKMGAIIMVLTFTLATIAVFANQMLSFGFVSILFIAMASFILMTTLKNGKNLN